MNSAAMPAQARITLKILSADVASSHKRRLQITIPCTEMQFNRIPTLRRRSSSYHMSLDFSLPFARMLQSSGKLSRPRYNLKILGTRADQYYPIKTALPSPRLMVEAMHPSAILGCTSASLTSHSTISACIKNHRRCLGTRLYTWYHHAVVRARRRPTALHLESRA